jgi:hypothetical protein
VAIRAGFACGGLGKDSVGGRATRPPVNRRPRTVITRLGHNQLTANFKSFIAS